MCEDEFTWYWCNYCRKVIPPLKYCKTVYCRLTCRFQACPEYKQVVKWITMTCTDCEANMVVGDGTYNVVD